MISPALYSGPTLDVDGLNRLLPLLDSSHPSYSLVKYLVQHHPKAMPREALRQATGTAGKEIALAASFEWRLLRANDTLPLLGWIIVSGNEQYRLEKLNP